MELSALLSGAGIAYGAANGYEIEDIVYDSRKAAPRTVFVALRGYQSDGHNYMGAAYRAGCRVFVCEREADLPADALQITVADTTLALASLSECFFGFPARSLKLIGVTGTKGKTTVASLIREILRACGKKADLIGTTGVFIKDRRYPTANTTPESYKLQKYFAEMAAHGAEYAVMEVSSQAYLRGRVAGLTFDYGIFTNISDNEHIGPGECDDYAHYRACKGELFAHSRTSVINLDDAESDYFLGRAQGRVLTYGKRPDAQFSAADIHPWKNEREFGISFTAIQGGKRTAVKSRIPGEYSVYNLLAALAVVSECGISPSEAAKVIPRCTVRGRFEIVDALPDSTVIIDFAHNQLSLREVMQTIRAYSPERLVVLFGCVGGRSQVRRAGMGQAAAELADFVILTSDDPDDEPPEAIIADIAAGMEGYSTPCKVIPDRTEAIAWAIAHARAGDVLLLAGKGHQDYDLVMGKKLPYDERAAVRQAVAALAQTRIQ